MMTLNIIWMLVGWNVDLSRKGNNIKGHHKEEEPQTIKAQKEKYRPSFGHIWTSGFTSLKIFYFSLWLVCPTWQKLILEMSQTRDILLTLPPRDSVQLHHVDYFVQRLWTTSMLICSLCKLISLPITHCNKTRPRTGSSAFHYIS